MKISEQLTGFYHYVGKENSMFNTLKIKYGIIICDRFSFKNKEEHYMYYDAFKNKDIYKPSSNRKNIGLRIFYYDFNIKNVVEIKGLKNLNKKYSNSFIKNNLKFIHSQYDFDFESAYRTIKIQKLIKNIKK